MNIHSPVLSWKWAKSPHTHVVSSLFCFVLFFLFCSVGRDSPADTHLKGFPHMISSALPIYAQLWHLRAPLKRERWQKDGWPRYFRTQLLLFPRSANTGSHKDRAGLWEGREGKPLAQLLIWYSRLVRKGRWSSTPHPHILTYRHTRNLSLPAMQTHTDYVKRVHGCVWKISAAVVQLILALTWRPSLTLLSIDRHLCSGLNWCKIHFSVSFKMNAITWWSSHWLGR